MDPNGKIKLALGLDAYGEKFKMNVTLSEFVIPHSEDDSCIDPNPNDKISSPHSNSFVDLNGDCMPDIFLQKEHYTENYVQANYYENYYEIYIQKLHNGK